MIATSYLVFAADRFSFQSIIGLLEKMQKKAEQGEEMQAKWGSGDT